VLYDAAMAMDMNKFYKIAGLFFGGQEGENEMFEKWDRKESIVEMAREIYVTHCEENLQLAPEAVADRCLELASAFYDRVDDFFKKK
jgi:hypothetical protein